MKKKIEIIKIHKTCARCKVKAKKNKTSVDFICIESENIPVKKRCFMLCLNCEIDFWQNLNRFLKNQKK